MPHLYRIRQCVDLKSLDVKLGARPSEPDASRFATEATATIASLIKLEVVKLPALIALQANVWCALRQLPSLLQLYCTERALADQDVPHIEHLDLGQGFTGLKVLECLLSYRQAMQIATSQSPNLAISSMTLHVNDASTTNSWGPLLGAISATVPRTEDCTVIMYGNSVPLQLCDLVPLIHSPQIIHLRIINSVVSDLSDSDYNTLAISLPYLQTLIISPEPSQTSGPSSATLHALGNIALHCKAIKHVAIYADVSVERLPSQDDYLHPFAASLKELSLGSSTVGHVQEVALRLSRMLLWSDPVLYVYKAPPGAVVDLPAPDIHARAVESWRLVSVAIADMRPLIQAMQLALHERIVTLEAENKSNKGKLEELEMMNQGSISAARIGQLETENSRMSRRLAELEAMRARVLETVSGTEATEEYGPVLDTPSIP